MLTRVLRYTWDYMYLILYIMLHSTTLSWRSWQVMIEDVQRNGFGESGIEMMLQKDGEVKGREGGVKMW